MSISHYLKPVDVKSFSKGKEFAETQWGNCLKFEVEDFSVIDVAIFDVAEDRGSISNKGCAKAGDSIREYFYSLYRGDYAAKVADLGTIEAGNAISDTYFAVQETIAFLLSENVIPMIIGGSQDISFANYTAYGKQEQTVNLVSIDARFGLGKTDDVINSDNYLSKILFHQPNCLFNYSNIGFQSYLVDQKERALLEELFYDIYRLGVVKEDLKFAEPIIRNADFISFNMSAVAQAYAPANRNASANGFTGEQACQLAKYAGMNDKLSSFSIYEYNPELADQGMTAQLIAQMIWYFIDGVYHRKGDFPVANKNQYTKYNVSNKNHKEELVFYKSAKTDRWWMEVPYYNSGFNKYARHLMLPCNYEEYLVATNDEIPERWFQTFKKLK